MAEQQSSITYNGRTYRPPLETEEQSRLISWARSTASMQTDPAKRAALEWLHAVPNGTHKNFMSRIKHQSEGLTSGVLDLDLMFAAQGFNGYRIEMKRLGESLTPDQEKFMRVCDLLNYKRDVFFFWEYAARSIVEYMGLTEYREIGEPIWLRIVAQVKRDRERDKLRKQATKLPRTRTGRARTARE